MKIAEIQAFNCLTIRMYYKFCLILDIPFTELVNNQAANINILDRVYNLTGTDCKFKITKDNKTFIYFNDVLERVLDQKKTKQLQTKIVNKSDEDILVILTKMIDSAKAKAAKSAKSV